MKITAPLLGIGYLGLLPCSLHAQEKFTGKGIDPATVAAFNKAGWRYGGWTKNPRDGGVVFRNYSRNGHPGFSLPPDVRYGVKNKPPEVASPFGLRFKDID